MLNAGVFRYHSVLVPWYLGISFLWRMLLCRVHLSWRDSIRAILLEIVNSGEAIRPSARSFAVDQGI